MERKLSLTEFTEVARPEKERVKGVGTMQPGRAIRLL